MASLEKRNGQWRVRWRDPDGQPRSRQCPTKAAAQALAREVEASVAVGRRWEPRDARPAADLRLLLRDYIAECARVLRPGTAERYARNLDLFLRFLDRTQGKGAPVPPESLTRRLLTDFHTDLAHGGLHGRDRADATRRKIVEVVQLAWKWLYDNDDTGAEIPSPRTIRLAREPARPTVAPRWSEMDACIGALDGWQRDLAVLLRFTGLRVQQAMSLTWDDLDLRESRLTVRGELGKSQQERRGRIVPVSRHLVQHVSGWERDDGPHLVTSSRERGGERERMARARDVDRAWMRAGVRTDAWRGRPHHAFRKGFVSELKRAGADADAVEYLVGHSLGLRGVYIDADALPLRAAVECIPDLDTVSFGAVDRRDRRPLRVITLEPVCPERVPKAQSRTNNVVWLNAFRKVDGGGGSRTRQPALRQRPFLTERRGPQLRGQGARREAYSCTRPTQRHSPRSCGPGDRVRKVEAAAGGRSVQQGRRGSGRVRPVRAHHAGQRSVSAATGDLHGSTLGYLDGVSGVAPVTAHGVVSGVAVGVLTNLWVVPAAAVEGTAEVSDVVVWHAGSDLETTLSTATSGQNIPHHTLSRRMPDFDGDGLSDLLVEAGIGDEPARVAFFGHGFGLPL